jgi:hypothetical protein
MNRYRVLDPPDSWPASLPFPGYQTVDGAYGPGEEFTVDLAPEDELANLESGLLALVPNRYRVIGEAPVDGHEPGEEFEAAIPKARERQLAGNLERLDPPKPPPAQRAAKKVKG